MAKRNFAALLLAIIVAVSTNTRADQAFMGADGCAVLAQVVYTEVTAAAWGSSPVPSFLDSEPLRTEVSVCNRTAHTVSEAFALAMTSVGSGFSWDYPTGDPGDYCWGGFLDQCYPQRAPLGIEANAWTAVNETMRYAMPTGSASDQSVFSGGAMRKALRMALRREARLN
jgi:hypothetical protein